ncbi:MAG: clostripain-related cysteine peptidase [Spirochaetia bacterium]
MKKMLFSLLVLFLVFFFSCENEMAGDAESPVITGFTAPSIIYLNSFEITIVAEDNVGVTQWYVSASGETPNASSSWLDYCPQEWNLNELGDHTLYAWVRDASGNISDAATVVVTYAEDTNAPAVTLTADSTTTSYDIPITLFEATDEETDIAGYMILDNSELPDVDSELWQEEPQETYGVSSNDSGMYTFYGFAKDENGNIGVSEAVTVNYIDSSDTQAPTVDSFTLPETTNDREITITSFSASDDVEVTGYMITDTATAPDSLAAGWDSSPQTSFTIEDVFGDVTLYAWAKDIGGNVSVSAEAIVTRSAEWLIMYYCDADNDLEQYLMADVNEIEGVDFSNKNIAVVALIDRVSGYYSQDGDWTETRAYELGYDSSGYNSTMTANSERIALPTLGITESNSIELNMGDPATLQGFIEDVIAAYPADSTMLLFSNHGGGWRDDEEAAEERIERMVVDKAICWDETDDNDSLYISEVRAAVSAALGSGNTVDILAMDACLMGMVEVAYEFRGIADIMIASSQTIPGFGYPYTQVMQAIAAEPGTVTPNRFSEILVTEYFDTYENGGHVEAPSYSGASFGYDYSLSAVDLTQIGSVVAEVNSLGSSLSGYSNIDSWLQTVKFAGADSLDLYHFCENEDAASYASVMTAIDSAVLYHQAGSTLSDTRGLGIFFPIHSDYMSGDYSSTNIQFCSDAPNWPSFLTSLSPTAATDQLELAGVSNTSTPLGNNDWLSAYYNAGLTDGSPVTSYVCNSTDSDWFHIPYVDGDFTVDLTVPVSGDYELMVYGIMNAGYLDTAPLEYSLNAGSGVDESVTITDSSGNYTTYGYVVEVYSYSGASLTDEYTIVYTE